ncbi:hypothetical protein LPTSP3_g22780 [Leptospira kobayashii]|uniref:Lipoprotein n=1 Tax=Leptospira kobayashii TaxID=1917830 RepID=A0ABM7UKH2_9LEPT|nr:hypothetical protein LPTSP3_g22780 [Leptospira kobayashii]
MNLIKNITAFLLILLFLCFCNKKNDDPLTNKDLGNVLLLYVFLDGLCNYNMVASKGADFPTITIPSSGRYKICGNIRATVRVKFDDYSKAYKITTIPGSSSYYDSSCQYVTTPLAVYMSELAANTITQLVSVEEPKKIIRPNQTYLYSVSSPSSGGVSQCTNNGKLLGSSSNYVLEIEAE